MKLLMKLFTFFDKLPLVLLVFLALFMAIAPLGASHLLQKLNMLSAGNLIKPIDIFDLFIHSLGLILLAIKLMRMGTKK